MYKAVIDVINSKTSKEAKASISQLEGNLSISIKEIRKDLISGLADIEASIDYPEYDEVEITNQKILETLNRNKIRLIELENSFINGKILREGIKTAIIGRPNSGKSSLLNMLLNEERAIVTDIEGTTRDSIEEFISIEGVPFKIIDTAGIRDTNDKVEMIGVEKAQKIANSSDLIIAIFDISRSLNNEDIKILEILKNKNAIVVINKIDLDKVCVDESIIKKYCDKIVYMSIKNKKGVKDLFDFLKQLVNNKEIESDGEVLITSQRHKTLISNAKISLENAIESLNLGMPVDVISIHIKEILEQLGKITGETVTDDVINEIFSKFCLGK